MPKSEMIVDIDTEEILRNITEELFEIVRDQAKVMKIQQIVLKELENY